MSRCPDRPLRLIALLPLALATALAWGQSKNELEMRSDALQ